MYKFTISTFVMSAVLYFSVPVASGFAGQTGTATVVGSTGVGQVTNCSPVSDDYVAVSPERFGDCGQQVVIAAFGSVQRVVTGAVGGICHDCGLNDILVSMRLAEDLLAQDVAHLEHDFSVKWRLE